MIVPMRPEDGETTVLPAFREVAEERDPNGELGLGEPVAETEETPIFTDGTNVFGVRVHTRTNQTYWSRWYPIDKLDQFTAYHESKMEGDEDAWLGMYLTEGIVYIKCREIVSVTFFSKLHYDREQSRERHPGRREQGYSG